MNKIVNQLGQSLCLPMLSLTTILFCIVPNAYAADTYQFIGKDANYDGNCNMPECNEDPGCRVFSQIYDVWYAGYSCTGSEDQGGSCDQNFRLCREIQHWTNTNCSWPLQYTEWVNQGLCSGGGTPVEPPIGGG